MEKIFKYELKITQGNQTILMPKGADILCFQEQNDTPYIWAAVDSESEDYLPFTFRLYATGEEMEQDEQRTYLGTIIIKHLGLFVLHCYHIY
jgi:hypothetical protein